MRNNCRLARRKDEIMDTKELKDKLNQLDNEKANLSDSTYQQKSEPIIVKEFIESVVKTVDVNNSGIVVKTSGGRKVKFQFDINIESANTIGEVYVTELPFNSGRKRKFLADILKMITFEELVKEKLTKYYIITVRKEDEDENITFIEHEDSNSLVGQSGWLNETLRLFGIKLYYCQLPIKMGNELKSFRLRQVKGMKR